MANKKIGDYVHLYKINYSRGGTNKLGPGGKGYPDFNKVGHQVIKQRAVILSNRNQYFNSMNETELENLQNSINALFSTKTERDNMNSKYKKDAIELIWRKIREEMDIEFKSALQTIIEETGNVKTKKAKTSEGKLSKIRTKDQEASKLQTVISKYNSLIDFFRERQGELEPNDVKNFVAAMKKLSTQILAMQKQVGGKLGILLESKTQQIGGNKFTSFSYKDGNIGRQSNISYTKEKFAIKNKKGEKEIFHINEVINDIYQAEEIISTGYKLSEQKGELLEIAIKYASILPQLIDKLANNSANENIEKIVNDLIKNSISKNVGRMGSAVEVDLNLFDNGIGNFLELPSYTRSGNTLSFQSGKTVQDKTDVIFSFGLNKPIYNISAKNVNLDPNIPKKFRHNIHLVSDSSLLYMLQYANPTLANHFLNIAVKQQNEIKDSPRKKEKNTPKGTKTTAITTDFINTVHKELEMFLIFEAFSGNIGTRRAASIFLVNDNSTGKVKVFNIENIMQNLYNYKNDNLKLFQVKLKNGGEISSLQNTLDNQFCASGPKERIAKILQQVHQQKISVSFDPNYLNKI